MTPSQYHKILCSLSQAELHFESSSADWTPEDRELYKALRVVRAEVLRRESGHPFPTQSLVAPAATIPSADVVLDEATSSAGDTAFPRQKIRVLIVDDETSVRTVLGLLVSGASDMEVVGE